MAKSLYYAPAEILFTAEGVHYSITESATSGSTSNAPTALGFQIDYFIAPSGPGSIAVEGQYTLTVIAYAELVARGSSRIYRWDVDLTNIIAAYTQRICRFGNYLSGYATVQLTEIDGVQTSIDEVEHICLFGTSGGIDLNEELPANQHPFLLARSNDGGNLHFYRSELKAMDFIYALKPSAYDSIYFDTDDYKAPQQELIQDSYIIRGRNELLGIHYYEGDAYNQYDVTAADVIFVHFVKDNNEVRLYSIAVQDDPEADETHLIRWTNCMGATEALLCTGEMRDISEVGQPEFYIQEQEYSHINRKQQRGMTTIKYSLMTGHLTPGRISALSDMLTSKEVEMFINGEWVPVSVTADASHAVHQREPENFELTIEVLEQTRYRKPNRAVEPIDNPDDVLRDKNNKVITDKNSNILY